MPGYSIFISYAHEDEPFKNALTQQLKGLQRQGLIAPWDDRCIDGGEEWRADIRTAIDGCQLALLLVSPAFIASDFIYTEELSRLLERRTREGIRVVPIIVKPCAWKHEKPIEALQARPKDVKAIVTFPEENGARAQAWLDIVDEIAKWARQHGDNSTRAPDQPIAPSVSEFAGAEAASGAAPASMPSAAVPAPARSLVYISYRRRDRGWHSKREASWTRMRDCATSFGTTRRLPRPPACGSKSPSTSPALGS